MADTTISGAVTGNVTLTNADDTVTFLDGTSLNGSVNLGDGDASVVINDNVTITQETRIGSGEANVQIGEGVSLEFTNVTGGVNALNITSDGDDTLIMGGAGATSTINGNLTVGGDIDIQNTSIVRGFATNDNDDDTINLEDVTILGDVSTSNGDDSVTIGSNSFLGGSFRLGDGDHGVSIGENVTITHETFLNAGESSIVVGQGTSLGNGNRTGEVDALNVSSAGEDTLIVGGSASLTTIDGNVSIGGSIDVQNTSVIGNFATRNDNDDTINFEDVTITGDVSTGQGNDAVSISDNSSLGGSFHLGDGSHEITIGEGVTIADETQISGNVIDDTRLLVGQGSYLGQGERTGESTALSISSGGEDTLVVGGATVETTLDGNVFVGGEISITNTSVRGNFSTNDNDSDEIILTDVTIDGDVATSNGNDTVSISDNSSIGGSFHLGDGSHEITIGAGVRIEDETQISGDPNSDTSLLVGEGSYLGQGERTGESTALSINSGGDDTIVVGGAGAETTLDGNVFAGGEVSLTNTSVSGGYSTSNDADDEIVFTDVTVDGDVSTSQGDDTVSISDNSSIGGSFHLGDGSHEITVGEGVRIEDETQISGDANSDTSLLIGQGSYLGQGERTGESTALSINSGGDDTLVVGGVSSETTLDGNVFAGGEVSVTNTSVVGNFSTNDNEDDEINFSDVTITGNLSTSGGDDFVNLSSFNTSGGFVDGGNDNDTLVLDNAALISASGVTFVPGTLPPAFEASLLSNDTTWDVTLQNGDTFQARNFEVLSATVCFASGTRIDTSHGQVKVEDLSIGDLVTSFDNGYQKVHWMNSARFTREQIATNPGLAPVRIKCGSLGLGLPERDLWVSQQHRMFVSNRVAQRVMGTRETLVAAKQLVAIDGIDIVHDVDEIEYVHFLCERHELVYAEGALSETLYTGPEAIKSLPMEAVKEIFEIFPELAKHARTGQLPTPARPVYRAKLGRRMAQRIQKNGNKVLEHCPTR